MSFKASFSKSFLDGLETALGLELQLSGRAFALCTADPGQTWFYPQHPIWSKFRASCCQQGQQLVGAFGMNESWATLSPLLLVNIVATV